jgi:uncharacterized protein YcgL (UPF0745 family)
MPACRIYRSERKAETYLYLAEELDFDELPAGLRRHFGQPAFVMRLEIRPATRLARVAAADVLRALENEGYFLQLPPERPVEEEITRRFGGA